MPAGRYRFPAFIASPVGRGGALPAMTLMSEPRFSKLVAAWGRIFTPTWKCDRNAHRDLARGDVIVGHDYGLMPNVSNALDRFARELGQHEALCA